MSERSEQQSGEQSKIGERIEDKQLKASEQRSRSASKIRKQNEFKMSERSEQSESRLSENQSELREEKEIIEQSLVSSILVSPPKQVLVINNSKSSNFILGTKDNVGYRLTILNSTNNNKYVIFEFETNQDASIKNIVYISTQNKEAVNVDILTAKSYVNDLLKNNATIKINFSFYDVNGVFKCDNKNCINNDILKSTIVWPNEWNSIMLNSKYSYHTYSGEYVKVNIENLIDWKIIA